MKSWLLGVLASTALAGAAVAGTTPVEVNAQSGPWDPIANASLDYGTHDGLAPSSVNVSAGETLTLTYASGFTSAFLDVPPSYIDADGYSVAAGYPSDYYGSGPGRTGVGSSGEYLPSYFIDPANVGPGYINLLELIGDFSTATGAVVGTPFAVGDGPLTITVPTGATQLQLGFNDDIFFDNSGGVIVDVAGLVSAAPEPVDWMLMLMGVAFAGAALRASRRLRQPASA